MTTFARLQVFLLFDSFCVINCLSISVAGKDEVKRLLISRTNGLIHVVIRLLPYHHAAVFVGEIIVDTYSPPFGFEKDEQECNHIVEILRTSKANVVLVGLGNPKQTKWIYKYKDKLPNINLFMALGATIDFEAGNIKRAPKIFQKLYMEWFYRFLMEPKSIRLMRERWSIKVLNFHSNSRRLIT